MDMQKLQMEAQGVRGALLECMERAEALDTKGGGRLASAHFRDAKAALRKRDFNVVVCGEVKRGKSSLINALIGQDVLPTGVRETTSQVFRINNLPSGKAWYELVFEDGARDRIQQAELARFGSQTAAEAENEPLLRGRKLKWIELNVRPAWLPSGVHLVDTPGLGALYARHSEITREFIQEADAVVYVLDSDQPLMQTDRRFLEEVYAITPHVLFAQTKIDMKDEAEWRALLKRNVELLRTVAGKNADAPRIFPVSGRLMREADAATNEQMRQELMEDSGLRPFMAALQMLIFRATGWTHCAWAAAETMRLADAAGKRMGEQMAMLQARTEEERKALKKNKLELHGKFQKDWAEHGGRRAAFRKELETILAAVKQEAAFLTANGKPLRKKLMAEIDELSSRDTVEAYAAAFPDHLKHCFNDAWRAVLLNAQEQIAKLSSQFRMRLDDEELMSLDFAKPKIRQASMWDRIKTVNIDAMVGGGLAAILATGVGMIGLTTLVAVVGTPLILLGGAIGGFLGFKKIAGVHLDQAKNELRQQVSGLLDEYRNVLCSPNIQEGRNTSVVEQFVESLREQVEGATQQEYESMRQQLQEEEEQLEEQSQKQGKQGEQELARLESVRKQWQGIRDEGMPLVERLKRMQTQLEQVGVAEA